MEKLKSGVEGFDIISKGGLPKNRTTLISGTPGSGKTIFCVQFLLRGIMDSNEQGVYITFEESPEELINNMKGIGWDISKYIDDGFWKFIDATPEFDDYTEYSDNYDLNGLFIRIKTAIEEIKAKRVAIDSIATLFNILPNKTIVRNELLRLKSFLNSLSVTSLITSEIYSESDNNSHYDVLDFISDNVIYLRNSLNEEHRRRTIEILKFRGSDHQKGQHSFTIRSNKGIVVISFKQNPQFKFSNKRCSSGISKLDKLIGDGFFEGTSILISGDTGTGKTLFTLTLVNGMLKQNKKVLMFDFEESYDGIMFKARAWNMELEKFIREKKFKLLCIYPETTSIEDLIVEIKDAIDQFSPDVIVLDSISALERITTILTYRESLINLLLFLREINITSILTSTIPTFSSKNLSDKQLSTLTDVIILLRFFERDSSIKRALGIIKMRNSNHIKNFYEYSIESDGFHILDPIDFEIGKFIQ